MKHGTGCRFNGEKSSNSMVDRHRDSSLGSISRELATLLFLSLSFSLEEKVESPRKDLSLSNIRPGWRTIVLLANWFP